MISERKRVQRCSNVDVDVTLLKELRVRAVASATVSYRGNMLLGYYECWEYKKPQSCWFLIG